MAMLIFTGLNALGVVFLVYVLVQFWKEGHQPTNRAARDEMIELLLKCKPTVIVVTRRISGGLQAEPGRSSGGLQVEPAPVSRSAPGGLSVVSRQGRMSDLQSGELHRDSANGADVIAVRRSSGR